MTDERLSFTQYTPGQREGHYESFYQRGNHPTRPLAFWIRYTIFSPKGRPEAAIGELWSIFFDGETGEHVATKEEHPIADTAWARDAFNVRIGDRVLSPGRLRGEASSSGNTIGWDLKYTDGQETIYLLPRSMYSGGFPKAKSLVGAPLSSYSGTLTVNGAQIDIDDWIGSQNHNWGSQHTDYYAFGQIAGFDDAPDSFLEVITAQTRVGPIRTPFMTLLVLRHRGREYALNSPNTARKAKGRFGYFDWDFATGNDEVRIEGRITAPGEAFVGLNYYNPPGGIKHCLNTKIGACELTVTDRATGTVETLRASHRALFEILTDDREHGVEIRA
ncbi:hypothetical protein OG792_15060 [Micromonospora sp. NBC_01699]|uniref:hypothetical protein n=1 Tax=Micromonospora sp. NBC_01699 TaxID=2975984 RepID=UPI002E3410B9|nr:hypothetical protein [Micromonospora sp. NBC_01699]